MQKNKKNVENQSELTEDAERKSKIEAIQKELVSFNIKPSVKVVKWLAWLDFSKQLTIRHKTKKDSYTPIIILGLKHFKPTILDIIFDIRVEPFEQKLYEKLKVHADEYTLFQEVSITQEEKNPSNEEANNQSKYVQWFFSLVIVPSHKSLKKFKLRTVNQTSVIEIAERLGEFNELEELQIPIPKSFHRFRVAFENLNLPNLRSLVLGADNISMRKNENVIELLKILPRFPNLQKLRISYDLREREQQFIDTINQLEYLQEIHLDCQLNLTPAQAEQLYKKNIFLVDFKIGERSLHNIQDHETRKIVSLFEQRKLNYNRLVHILSKTKDWDIANNIRKEHILNMCEFIKFVVI